VTDDDETAEPDYCEFVIFSETRVDPAEYCEEYALPGEAFCAAHLPWTE
jgi:hypothetical protein